MIEQRKQLKPPATYLQRENVADFREPMNGTLHLAQGGSVDSLDISTAESGTILAAVSTNNEVKVLDRDGALKETHTMSARTNLVKFAPNSDSIAIFTFGTRLATFIVNNDFNIVS